jgi:hypothetical protein
VSSPFDGRSRRLLWWALAFLCAREMISTCAAVGPSLPLVLLTAFGLAALLSFALQRWPIAAGMAALASLSVLSQTHALLSGGPMRHEFAVGVALLGWLCGVAFARGQKVDELAEAGAVAALAATYVSAGMSKLVKGQLVWAESATLRAMLAAHHPVDGGSYFDAYAQKIIESAGLAQALGWATLAIQLGAPLLLVGRRWRMLWGTLLIVFHLQVAWLTGIYYSGAIYLLVVFSYPWPLPSAGRQEGFRVLGSR